MSIIGEDKKTCSGMERGVDHSGKMLYSVEYLRTEEADDRIRTYDLLITNQLLYRLSYVGEKQRQG
jgi:hypothetical protein